MAEETVGSGTSGNPEALTQAKDIGAAEGLGSCHGVEIHEKYVVTPIAGPPSGEKDETGALVASGTTLWVHHRIRREWGFVYYESNCWASVTDAEVGGNPVKVDQLEAHLVHDSNFGTNVKTERNASSAHARTRISGVAVANPGVSGWACAEHSGYNRSCSDSTRA